MEDSLRGTDVAKYIARTLPCTLRRANRLTYLCYSDYLHSTGKVMFSDRITPTRYGPVVETVHRDFMVYCRETAGRPADTLSYRLDDTDVLEVSEDVSVLRDRILSATDGREVLDCIDSVLRGCTRRDDGESFIENNFLTVAGDGDMEGDFNADRMDEIPRSLTVGRNVMTDPYSPQVFVEGITDYNYLTAFAELLGERDITFMPVGGLKNEGLGEKLRKVTRDPILLVDADRAGYAAKSDLGKRVQVIPLSDIDPGFRGDYDYSDFREKGDGARGFTIEDLFSESDREWILKGRKESDFSSVFKTYIDSYDDSISKETRENFSKVFAYLKQEFMIE